MGDGDTLADVETVSVGDGVTVSDGVTLAVTLADADVVAVHVSVAVTLADVESDGVTVGVTVDDTVVVVVGDGDSGRHLHPKHRLEQNSIRCNRSAVDPAATHSPVAVRTARYRVDLQWVVHQRAIVASAPA